MTDLLADKIIAISGAGPGLGQSIAHACLSHGAHGVALGARTEAKVLELCEQLQHEFPEAVVHGHALDITSDHSCEQFLSSVEAQFGRLDALFNNAYRGNETKALQPTSDSDWETVFRVNVVGTQRLSHAAIPLLTQSASPRIVHVTSMSARTAEPVHGAYGASKATLGWLTRAMATDLAPQRIRVNALQPGWMLGPAVEAFFARTAEAQGVTPQEVKAGIVADIPLGFMPTDADVAGTAVFLASDLSHPITGQILDVNGGHFY